MGFEPMNTGFADQRVSHFAIGARAARAQSTSEPAGGAIHKITLIDAAYFGCGAVRRYGFTVL
jgi:hypothetical protein